MTALSPADLAAALTATHAELVAAREAWQAATPDRPAWVDAEGLTPIGPRLDTTGRPILADMLRAEAEVLVALAHVTTLLAAADVADLAALAVHTTRPTFPKEPPA